MTFILGPTSSGLQPGQTFPLRQLCLTAAVIGRFGISENPEFRPDGTA